MSRKHKKFCTKLNYIEYFLMLASTITKYILVSAIASLLGILKEITSSALGLKSICTITAGIKKYQSIIKKKTKKHYTKVLLAKSKLNSIV